MDVLFGTLISSIESVSIHTYQTVSSFISDNIRSKSGSEGFKDYASYNSTEIDKSGQNSSDIYIKYKPYLKKSESSSRQQIDNHNWPRNNEMNGPMEPIVRTDMVLPCEYPTPVLGNSVKYSVKYSSFI